MAVVGSLERTWYDLELYATILMLSRIQSYDSIVRDLALRTGFAVVFPEYTLVPEAVYPTQQEECYAVLKWVSKNGKRKGLKQDSFALVGDSAGGKQPNLACELYNSS